MFTVVALGIANAGKSSVLSALADQKGLFPVGDLPRVTRLVQRETVGPLVLVDTPGLDADPAESNQAMQEARAADTVLWCHSLRMGEMRPTEIAALRQYAAFKRNISRICFVLTHADNVACDEIISEVTRKIACQLEEVFGWRFHPFREPSAELGPGERRPRPLNVVGIEFYWREKRLERSGIPRLRTHLMRLAQAHLAKE